MPALGEIKMSGVIAFKMPSPDENVQFEPMETPHLGLHIPHVSALQTHCRVLLLRAP